MCRGSFSEEAATAVLQPGTTAASLLLQDLSDACMLQRAATSTSPRHSLHPLVWDFAEQARQAQPQPQQMPALEAFLHWMLTFNDRVTELWPMSDSAAGLSQAKQLLADELPNVSALAAQLGQAPLCDVTAAGAEDTLSRLDGAANTLSRLCSLAVTLTSCLQLAVAIELLQPVVVASRRLLGLAHKITMRNTGTLACFLSQSGRAESWQMLQRLLQQAKAELGCEHEMTLDIMDIIACGLGGEGRWAEAAEQYHLTFELRQRASGELKVDAWESLAYSALCYGRLGDNAKALDMHCRVLAARQDVLGPEDSTTLISHSSVAECLGKLGRHDEAVQHRRRVLQVMQRGTGPHVRTLEAASMLIMALGQTGNQTEAHALLQQQLAMVCQHGAVSEYADVLHGASFLAEAACALRLHAHAVVLLHWVLQLRQRVLAPHDFAALSTTDQLAAQLRASTQQREAARQYQDVLQASVRIGEASEHLYCALNEVDGLFAQLARI